MREACRFHFMVPFLAMAKLERARFCAWLIESVVFLVLVVTLVSPCQQVVVNHRKLYLLFRFWGRSHPLNVNLGVEKHKFRG